jgi:hypothetical protein
MSIKQAAQWIKQIHEQRYELLKKNPAINNRARSA